MREIKFRGKRKDTGEWVFGNYIKRNLDGIPQYYIYDNQWDETEIDGYCDDDDAKIYLKDCFIEVIPETVGQFTGLFDKNGKEIYTQDIVKSGNGRIWIVRFGKFKYTHPGNVFEGYGYYAEPKENELKEKGNGYLCEGDEIIGNRFDNPEL